MRGDRVRPLPRRPRADAGGLRRDHALSALCGVSRDVRAELHGHRRQDHPARQPGGGPRPRGVGALHRGLPRGHGRARRAAAGRRAEGHRARPRDDRADRAPGGPRLRLRGGRRRVLRGAAVPRLRQAVGQEPRRAAGRRARRGRRAQAGSARLRAVEGRQAGRALVGEPVGPRPPGLAHRVLGHVEPLSGRDLRHPRRRRGPHLPAPRVRDRPVGGRHRQAVRALLAAQRHGEHAAGEDVEVAGQHAHDPRPGHPPRPGRAAPVPARHALSQSAGVGGGARGGQRACPGAPLAPGRRRRQARGLGRRRRRTRRFPRDLPVFRQRFLDAMDDDFNTPEALARAPRPESDPTVG